MTREDTLLRVVGQIYDAAGSPDKWATCLASICDLFSGTAAHLLHHDHRSHDGGISVTTLQDPAVIQAYAQHFYNLDPWALKLGAAAVSAGQVVLGQSLVPHREMVKTEFYSDLGQPTGLTRTLIGFLEASSSQVSAALTINRPDAGREFGPEETRLAETLVPHLQRAFALHRRLTNIDAERNAAASVIDRLAVAVILVDANAQPILVNEAARRLLSQRDGLVLDRNGLRAGTTRLTNELRRSIASAADVTRGALFNVSDGVLTIPRPSGLRPYQVVVTPVTRSNAYAGDAGNAAAAIFITDPEQLPVPSELQLQQLYQLTPKEAQVALAIAEGHRVAEIADLQQMTQSTVRWYIKQVLAKTGASTQAQLVRVVLSVPRLAV